MLCNKIFFLALLITKELKNALMHDENLLGKARKYFSDTAFTGYCQALNFEELRRDGACTALNGSTFTTELTLVEKEKGEDEEVLPAYMVSFHSQVKATKCLLESSLPRVSI